MPLSKQEFAGFIKECRFRDLFNEMGWNNDPTTQLVIIDNTTFTLRAVAEKRGFKILVCGTPAGNGLPDYSTRKSIETRVTKLFQEHLIIFHDIERREQVWQLTVRQADKPTRVTETRFHVSQDPELLYQRASGLFFELDEEEKITIVDVTKRVADNFQQNNEKVTKQFYDKFKKEHTAFLGFIKGIEDRANRDWYASLMLNRLMFCYFIQKKGFLDGNKNYLRDKLKACQEKKGRNQFYSFYRNFLLALFHQGLGAPGHDRELIEEIGKVPYLNGGLFDEHELEKSYKAIDIDDTAFEGIFDFFDQYEWHLDTRITATGKDINPDVIGHIFEKYINDRAQMGAYYTKEDITEYIAKNCIIPYLFDETKRRYPKAFEPEGELWRMVRASGDAYIYDAVKHGVNPDNLWADLPEDVRAGLDPEQPDLVEKRRCWNRPAPPDVALPTELWREVIDRRKRYGEVKGNIAKGEIVGINDFITYNLNIRQFAQDAVENTVDPDFLRHFYKAMSSVTILDPTCGSGAFLFAAMNILEPLYEGSILRMGNFVDEAPKGKHKFFEEALAQVKSPEHPCLQYFIFKSIILNNLYGVDIMNEAVEIAKLRLFLKLVATVEADYRKPNLGLEPLPDVDFNIRAGNTLIGYASERDLHKAFEGRFDFDNDEGKIKEKCDIVAHAFARYKEIQLSHGDDYKGFKDAKEELNGRLKALDNELNKLLHKQAYGKLSYDAWLASHQPFHWLAEFYEIVHDKGGFDVIIGNPPYLEYSKVSNYTVRDYATMTCANLYIYTVERTLFLTDLHGRFGMIVPISLACSGAMQPARNLLVRDARSLWLSHFANRPGQLFTGAQNRLTIFLTSGRHAEPEHLTTRYHRWDGRNGERDPLFDVLAYQSLSSNGPCYHGLFEKTGRKEAVSVLGKLVCGKTIGLHNSRQGTHRIFWVRVPGYFCQFLVEPPLARSLNGGSPRRRGETNSISFDEIAGRDTIHAVLNSSTYYQFFCSYTDTRHINPSDVAEFPLNIALFSPETRAKLVALSEELTKAFILHTTQVSKSGLAIDSIESRLCKPIIDQIDIVLAEHYGFTPEELDFIINYDIKYRMGKELEGDDEAD